MFMKRFFACTPMATFAVLLMTVIVVSLLLGRCVSYNVATLFSIGATILVEGFFALYVLCLTDTTPNRKE
jgi:hypothetical protein